MKTQFKRFVLEIVVVLVAVSGVGAYKGYKHTSYFPYANGQLHGHRWRTALCDAAHVDKKQCSLVIQNPGSSEVDYFDICLEHGELRKIQ